MTDRPARDDSGRRIALCGLSYRTAPVPVRELLAFSREALGQGLEGLQRLDGVAETVILSTCNRVEVYAVMEEALAAEELGRFLARFHHRPEEEVLGHAYHREGNDAIRHLFRVSAGLDSQVVGESQVLGQVKEAYQQAKARECTGRMLNLLFQKALKVGKDVRTETRIGATGASVSSAAIGFMRKIYEDLSKKTIFVVGSGEMGKITLAHLARHGVGALRIVNRSPGRARELAERYGGEVLAFEKMREHLAEADIVISSTAAPLAVIHAEDVRRAMKARRGAPQIYMDIAIPRDVDPEVGKISGVYLYNVDDIDRAISRNLEGLTQEIARGEGIVEGQVEAYLSMEARLDLGPVIRDMRRRVCELIRSELEVALENGSSLRLPGEVTVESLAERLAGKVLHGPIQALRNGDDEVVDALPDLVRRIFSFNGEPEPPEGDVEEVVLQALRREGADAWKSA